MFVINYIQGLQAYELKPHKLHTLHVDDNTNSESESELFIDTIEEVNSLTMDEWKETILVNNVPVKFQLDTGAKCNVMSLATLKATCSEPKIRRKDVPLKSYSGHLIKPMGPPLHAATEIKTFMLTFI